MAKLVASPEPNEQTENASVASTSNPLRDPVRSETAPMPKAASDHVSESAPEMSPTCVFVSPRSGWMNGIRKLGCVPVEQHESGSSGSTAR